MCDDTPTTPALSASGDPLAQVLLANSTPVPKVSIPVPAIEGLQAKKALLTSALGIEPDENQTYHLTSEEAFLSSNQKLTSDASESGTAVAVSGRAAVSLTVTPPQETDGLGFDPTEILKIGFSLLPLFLGATAAAPSTEPQVTLGIAVTGSSASIVECTTSQSASDALGAFGINVGCLVSTGGATILTTIVACLPALSAGPQAFREALMGLLGTTGVDLVTKVMACF
jgi:hypothetical protein